MRDFSEARLVEETCLAILRELGWQTLDATHEVLGESGTLGRESEREVVLRRELREALTRLNSGMHPSGIEQAVEILAQDRSALSAVGGNQELLSSAGSNWLSTNLGERGSGRHTPEWTYTLVCPTPRH